MKQASVFYKLPIEQMRGKLATKQADILYGGQVAGNNTLTLEEGKHLSTNFSKYVVLTVRRGVNRFYVKSRTTVTNTVGTIYSKVCMLLSMLLVDALYKAYKQDWIEMLGVKTSYDYWGGNKTFREYITSIVLTAVRERKQEITYNSVPNELGVYERVLLCNNPYYSFVSQSVTINGVDFSADNHVAGMIQANLQYFALAQDSTRKILNVIDSVSGTTYKCGINGQSTTTFNDISESLQGMCYRLSIQGDEIEDISVIDSKGEVRLQGKPYADSAKTEAISATQIITDGLTFYV